jgi:RNA polymerase sigma-70 factor (ECF subfamily)
MYRTDTEESDEKIAVAARTDTAHFAILIGRYSERLSRYLARLGVHTSEDREDILQNVFVKVYRNINGFDADLSFSSWVYRITHNEAMSFFRSRKARVEGHLADISNEVLEQVSGELSADTETERRINMQHLAGALDKLDPKYRDVLVLRFFEARDYSDISDILQIPMGSVATLLHRAKARLKKELEHIR